MKKNKQMNLYLSLKNFMTGMSDSGEEGNSVG